MLCFEF